MGCTKQRIRRSRDGRRMVDDIVDKGGLGAFVRGMASKELPVKMGFDETFR